MRGNLMEGRDERNGEHDPERESLVGRRDERNGGHDLERENLPDAIGR